MTSTQIIDSLGLVMAQSQIVDILGPVMVHDCAIMGPRLIHIYNVPPLSVLALSVLPWYVPYTIHTAMVHTIYYQYCYLFVLTHNKYWYIIRTTHITY